MMHSIEQLDIFDSLQGSGILTGLVVAASKGDTTVAFHKGFDRPEEHGDAIKLQSDTLFNRRVSH